MTTLEQPSMPQNELDDCSHLEAVLTGRGYRSQPACDCNDVVSRLECQLDLPSVAMCRERQNNQKGSVVLCAVRSVNVRDIIISSACLPLQISDATQQGATDCVPTPIPSQVVPAVIRAPGQAPAGGPKVDNTTAEQVRSCHAEVRYWETSQMQEIQGLLGKVA